jgi:hypothetical protein
MRRISKLGLTSIGITIGIALTSAGPAGAAGATGAEANFGQCHRSTQVTGAENAWYAPGVYGNAPLVLVNGEVKFAKAFGGGFGCYL